MPVELIAVIAAIFAAIIAAIPPTILALASYRATVKVDGKADTLIEKAVEIHTLTNSNLSQVTESLNVALARIEGLQTLVTSMVEAKKVADAFAIPRVSLSDDGNLKKIEINTQETTENTKKTDAAVNELQDKL